MSSDSAITVPFQMAVVMHVTVRAATDLFHRRRSVAADPRDAAAVLGLADEVPEHPRRPGDVSQRVCLSSGVQLSKVRPSQSMPLVLSMFLGGVRGFSAAYVPKGVPLGDRQVVAMIGSRNVSSSCRCSSPL